MKQPAPQTREQILEAARELIREKGAAHTSLADIANRTGIAKGTLHYHFASKGDLLYTLTSQQCTYFTDKFLEIAKAEICCTQSVADALENLITEILERSRDGILIHLIVEGVTANEELKNKFAALYRDWAQNIRKGLSSICKREVAQEEAELILSVLMGQVFHQVSQAPAVSPKLFLEFVLRGLHKCG